MGPEEVRANHDRICLWPLRPLQRVKLFTSGVLHGIR
jgi:hypothetical protein